MVSELVGCFDCGRQYGDEFGFPDLIIPFWAWEQISPHGDDSGLLCPSCICKRLHEAGIKCRGAFMSGPITSVSQDTMTLDRRIENIELAIEGRDNRWGHLLRAIKPGATNGVANLTALEGTTNDV